MGEVRGRGGRIVEGRERETEQITEVGPHRQEPIFRSVRI